MHGVDAVLRQIPAGFVRGIWQTRPLSEQTENLSASAITEAPSSVCLLAFLLCVDSSAQLSAGSELINLLGFINRSMSWLVGWLVAHSTGDSAKQPKTESSGFVRVWRGEHSASRCGCNSFLGASHQLTKSTISLPWRTLTERRVPISSQFILPAKRWGFICSSTSFVPAFRRKSERIFLQK